MDARLAYDGGHMADTKHAAAVGCPECRKWRWMAGDWALMRFPCLFRVPECLVSTGAGPPYGPVWVLGGTDGLCLHSVSNHCRRLGAVGWSLECVLDGVSDLVDVVGRALFCSSYTWYVRLRDFHARAVSMYGCRGMSSSLQQCLLH